MRGLVPFADVSSAEMAKVSDLMNAGREDEAFDLLAEAEARAEAARGGPTPQEQAQSQAALDALMAIVDQRVAEQMAGEAGQKAVLACFTDPPSLSSHPALLTPPLARAAATIPARLHEPHPVGHCHQHWPGGGAAVHPHLARAGAVRRGCHTGARQLPSRPGRGRGSCQLMGGRHGSCPAGRGGCGHHGSHSGAAAASREH